jgi:hypothetical protein
MKLYKIRHKVTGLFSAGGHSPSWTKKGKTWSSLGHLKNHINGVVEYRYHKMKDMENWEILEIEISETQSSIGNVVDIVNEKIQKEKDKKMAYELERKKQELIKKQAIAKLTPEERKALGYNY